MPGGVADAVSAAGEVGEEVGKEVVAVDDRADHSD